MVEIANLREKRPSQPFDVVVDRRSPLGNPYRMVSEEDRGRVCEMYEEYFRAAVDGDSRIPLARRLPLLQELARLEGIYAKHGRVRLFCWCYPKRCHAETIRRYLLEKKAAA